MGVGCIGVRRVAAAQAYDSKKINYCSGCCGGETGACSTRASLFLRLIAKVAKMERNPRALAPIPLWPVPGCL